MAITWFCVWQGAGANAGARVDEYDLNALKTLVRGCPGLSAGHVLTPAQAHDPHYAGEQEQVQPALVLQLDFADVLALETLLHPGAHLSVLAEPKFLPSLKGVPAAQQAMLARRYAVADDRIASGDGSSLSYWVEYAGPAEDENAWHVFYVAHHPYLLAKFPGIRAIDIYTPAVAICDLPLPVRPCMQRNKVVFDTPEAMTAAMQTPVRDALRADFHEFPAFTGHALHFPFRTWTYRP
jgi:hypothetical protein